MDTKRRMKCGTEAPNKKTKIEESLQEKFQRLREREKELDSQIATLESKGVSLDLTPQMQALHEYNEMKDLTQAVLGYLASGEQKTVAELHERYCLPLE